MIARHIEKTVKVTRLDRITRRYVDSYVTAHVVVDMAGLARHLAESALRNKSKISKLGGGLISVQVVNHRGEP